MVVTDGLHLPKRTPQREGFLPKGQKRRCASLASQCHAFRAPVPLPSDVTGAPTTQQLNYISLRSLAGISGAPDAPSSWPWPWGGMVLSCHGAVAPNTDTGANRTGTTQALEPSSA